MLILYVLGLFVLESFGIETLTLPDVLTVIREPDPEQFIVQSLGNMSAEEYSHIAVIVFPRQSETIIHGIEQSSSHILGDQNQESSKAVDKLQTITYTSLPPYPITKEKIYFKPKPTVEQYLKEVTPTTKTFYGEQKGSLGRYVYTTPSPQVFKQNQLKLHDRPTHHSTLAIYTEQPETISYFSHSQGYQIASSPQVRTPVISHENLQPYPLTESTTQHEPRQGEPQKQVNTENSNYNSPYTPVTYQKTMNEEPTEKLNGVQILQPSAYEEIDKTEYLSQPLHQEPHKFAYQQLIPVAQQILIPLYSPTQELIKYQPIQLIPVNQQVRPEPVSEQQVYVPVTQTGPLVELLGQPESLQLSTNSKTQPTKYVFQPQSTSYQNSINLQHVPANQDLHNYKSTEDVESQEKTTQEEDKKEKLDYQQLHRQPNKLKKPEFRLQKYRQHKIEEKENEDKPESATRNNQPSKKKLGSTDLRYRRPLQLNFRQILSNNKDNSVQITEN